MKNVRQKLRLTSSPNCNSSYSYVHVCANIIEIENIHSLPLWVCMGKPFPLKSHNNCYTQFVLALQSVILIQRLQYGCTFGLRDWFYLDILLWFSNWYNGFFQAYREKKEMWVMSWEYAYCEINIPDNRSFFKRNRHVRVVISVGVGCGVVSGISIINIIDIC